MHAGGRPVLLGGIGEVMESRWTRLTRPTRLTNDLIPTEEPRRAKKGSFGCRDRRCRRIEPHAPCTTTRVFPAVSLTSQPTKVREQTKVGSKPDSGVKRVEFRFIIQLSPSKCPETSSPTRCLCTRASWPIRGPTMDCGDQATTVATQANAAAAQATVLILEVVERAAET